MIEEALNNDVKCSQTVRGHRTLKAAAESKGLPLWTPEAEMSTFGKWKIRPSHCKTKQDYFTCIEQQPGSLTYKADLPEAHEHLIDFYLTLHQEAEASGDKIEMASAKCKMEFHLEQLHVDNSVRQKAVRYLSGMGQFSLTTSPSGAEVWLAEYEVIDRRLILQGTSIGIPPHEMPLGMGSYRLRQKGSEDVHYPNEGWRREGRWDNIDPMENNSQYHYQNWVVLVLKIAMSWWLALGGAIPMFS